jgi:hypothetical protein
MDAVQRMRKKAQDKGALKTTEQQKVETKVVESKTVIVVEQANPEVVYVPSYNPVVVLPIRSHCHFLQFKRLLPSCKQESEDEGDTWQHERGNLR